MLTEAAETTDEATEGSRSSLLWGGWFRCCSLIADSGATESGSVSSANAAAEGSCGFWFEWIWGFWFCGRIELLRIPFPAVAKRKLRRRLPTPMVIVVVGEGVWGGFMVLPNKGLPKLLLTLLLLERSCGLEGKRNEVSAGPPPPECRGETSKCLEVSVRLLKWIKRLKVKGEILRHFIVRSWLDSEIFD
jgi:hypothetical protein